MVEPDRCGKNNDKGEQDYFSLVGFAYTHKKKISAWNYFATKTRRHKVKKVLCAFVSWWQNGYIPFPKHYLENYIPYFC
jgi:hypothetical protein